MHWSYTMQPGKKKSPLNIVEFKTRLVELLVAQKLEIWAEGKNDGVELAMVKIPGNYHQRCSYCALMDRHRHTQFICEGCDAPYCSIGSGKTTKDCFALAHDNERIRQMCVEK